MKRSTGSLQGLTPLVDLLFILLFSLLAMSETRTSNRDERVGVQLPAVEPSTESSLAPNAALALAIDAESRVFEPASGRRLHTREDLERLLASELGDRLPEEVAVEIHADRDARHGVAVELLQHLRVRGFVQVQLVATGSGGLDAPFGGKSEEAAR